LGRHLRETLSRTLSSHDLNEVCASYDIVGEVAVLRLEESSNKTDQQVAQAVMSFHKNVKTVLVQTSPVGGDFRLRKLEYLAGEKRTATVHKESGCKFYVDLEKCYFSPRLSYERRRIAEKVQGSEVVVNMFAGVGCFSILIAKHSPTATVYSIDVNPDAFEHMKTNVRLNRVYGRVMPILGDAKEVIAQKLCHVADRVLMPLPEKAIEYLPWALLALRESGGWIHCYGFEHAKKGEDVVEKVKSKVSERLKTLAESFDVISGRVVRATGPNWYQVVLDIKVGSGLTAEVVS
jgi:tRNA (guanine37-N1)-methyltransferase